MLQFLRDQTQSVSGFSDEVKDPYALFVEKLRERDPELLEEGRLELDRITRTTRGRWEKLTKGDEEAEEGCAFSFGFGSGDEDEDVS